MANPGDVSPLTLNRLSVYLRSLRQLIEEGIQRVSSDELALRFHLSAAQIRKDLAQFGAFGIRGVGYEVEPLTEHLSGVLGLDHTHPLIIVGMGNLGNAFARYLEFNHGAFEVVAAVDHDPAKIGRRVGNITIEKASRLASIVNRTHAEIGVLAVPAGVAQENYDALVSAGVRAVLNFAPRRLAVDPSVVTRDVDLRIQLEALAFYVTQLRRPEPSGS